MPETNELVYQAALAGLLHDIGKVEQRAQVDPTKPAQGTEDSGQPVHATWSIYFADHHVPQPYKRFALMGAFHHRPEANPAEDRHISRLVALADKLSAGERADQTEAGKKPPTQLVTIFDRVSLDGKDRKGEAHYLPLQPLALDENAIFPAAVLETGQASRRYENLRDGLRKAMERQVNSLPAYLENALFALQRYAWSLPSAYYHSVPDISLYDHCRMTAALAACLADRKPEQIEELLSAVTNTFHEKASPGQAALLAEPAALLVGGDISGIQDFIYTISSKGAARMLRGRSFYLQLLTEAVLRYVLAELNLPYCNVIYSGGGHFFLLAPVSAGPKIEALRRQVTMKLLRHHGTQIYLALGQAVVPFNGFYPGVFPEHWGKMQAQLALAKQHRYTELGDMLHSEVFEPPKEGGNPEDTCDVCEDDQRKATAWDQEQGVKICSLCRSYEEELGRELPKTQFIALGFGAPEETKPVGAQSVLKEFGLQVELLESARDAPSLPGAAQVTFWALDDPKNDQWPAANGLPASHTLRYNVNQVPHENGAPLSFDKLQEKCENGFERLGVLRMDVDDLGNIFKHGLGKNATLARLAALSFQMSLYFEGWVKRLCEAGELKELVYAVYAGGDDVFLLGPWERMPGLAQEIRNGLANYTGGHPDIHISGGMAFIDGKYPVYQAAEDAKDALEQAKDLPGKNAFFFLSEGWRWGAFDDLSQSQERLRRIVLPKDQGGLEGPDSILQILRRLASDEAEQVRRTKGHRVFGPWMWRGPYQLKRMSERYDRNQPELAAEITAIRDELHKENYTRIHQWGVAARWAQLAIRNKKRKE